MIRMWSFSEAPEELRNAPGLAEALADKTRVPVWLAHWPDYEGKDATIFREVARSWISCPNQKVYSRHYRDLGCVQVGVHVLDVEVVALAFGEGEGSDQALAIR